MNENYEDGTYTYEDMTQDGSVLVVDMAFQSLRTNETAEEYAEYAARFAALDTGEGEPCNVTCFQDEDYTQNLSYPVYIVWYTTGSGEDQREWMVYTVDTDDYTYLYAFGTGTIGSAACTGSGRGLCAVPAFAAEAPAAPGTTGPVHRDGSAQRGVCPADAAVRLGGRTETLKIGRKRP